MKRAELEEVKNVRDRMQHTLQMAVSTSSDPRLSVDGRTSVMPIMRALRSHINALDKILAEAVVDDPPKRKEKVVQFRKDS